MEKKAATMPGSGRLRITGYSRRSLTNRSTSSLGYGRGNHSATLESITGWVRASSFRPPNRSPGSRSGSAASGLSKHPSDAQPNGTESSPSDFLEDSSIPEVCARPRNTYVRSEAVQNHSMWSMWVRQLDSIGGGMPRRSGCTRTQE